MKIVICDDEKKFTSELTELIHRWQEAKGVDTLSVSVFHSSEDLLETKDMGYDIAFLDIQFPGEMNGLQLAEQMRKVNEQVFIVFTTNYDEYAASGYRVNALRYLCKPVSEEDVAECLNIAYRQWKLSQDTFLVTESHGIVWRMAYHSISYIDSRAHYVYIHMDSDQQEIPVRAKLNDFLKNLPEEMFLQCHQSYIINLLYVQSISRTTVTLMNGTRIPVSSRYVQTVLTRFKSFYHDGGEEK